MLTFRLGCIMKAAMIAKVAIFMIPKRYTINAFNLEDLGSKFPVI